MLCEHSLALFIQAPVAISTIYVRHTELPNAATHFARGVGSASKNVAQCWTSVDTS